MDITAPLFSPIQLLNLCYVLILLASAGTFLYLKYLWQKKVPSLFFWLHFFIVTWSALMYLNLVYQTPIAPFTWYADWIVSTPLIMLALGLTAMYPFSAINISSLFALIGLQIVTIVTGILAHIAPTETGRLVFFGFGCLTMFAIFAELLGPIMQDAKRHRATYPKYKKLVNLLILFWLSYPVAWIIGTPGYKLIGPFATNVLFVILPILCKPVFGFIDLYLLKRIFEEQQK